MIDLDYEEKMIMEMFGKLDISQNKNVEFETIQKKLRPKYHANLKKNINKLITKGFIRLYRTNNYSLTDEGLRVAHFLWEKRKEKIYDFNFFYSFNPSSRRAASISVSSFFENVKRSLCFPSSLLKKLLPGTAATPISLTRYLANVMSSIPKLSGMSARI